MLNRDQTVLVIIDVQGKLATLMHGHENLFKNLERLVAGCRILDIPVIWLEQNPLGLGPTIPEIRDQLADLTPISKMSFSCCRNDEFSAALNESGRHQVLVAGIETHICVYQTVADLLRDGYGVHLVTDAVSSRTAANRDLAIGKMAAMGAELTGVEMALFEMLGVAEGKEFRKILKIIK
ncbi:MAG TPA: hydrolase [bacterium]|nr:hydrolase [bacterium]